MGKGFLSGSTVLFQGDSITDVHRKRENPNSLGEGYAYKVAEIYRILYPESRIRFVNRGISGNRAEDLLARYEEDFKSVRADFISILIGINDTWRRYDNNDPTSAEAFEANYRKLLTKIKRDMPSTRIIIMEPFVLHTLKDRITWHEDLDPKIQVTRKLAKEFADYYIPLDGIFQKYVIEGYREKDLASDGVHPTSTGHGIIAKEYMKALGII